MPDTDKRYKDGKKKRRRGMLKGMVFDEVSHVGRGANQGAHVSLIKMDLDETPEEVAKRSFNDVIMGMELGEEMEEFMKEIYETNHALKMSIAEILYSDEYPNKKESIMESIGQFMEMMTSMVDDLELIKSFDVIKQATKRERGKDFPASDFAYTPDRERPSTWKLRLTNDPGGEPDSRIVGAAVAALGPGGFRGNRVQIPRNAMAGVKAKVRRAWLKANPDKSRDDLPAAIKKSQEEIEMEKTLEFYKAMSVLSDDEKSYFNGLSESEQEKIVKEDSTEEAIVEAVKKGMKTVKKSQENDETFSMNGVEVKKSDVGEAAFAVMKAQQVQIEQANKDAKDAREKLEKADLEKEAAELFPNLPGTAEEKGAVLKSIRALPADQQEKQIQMLKAGDEAISKQMDEKGHGETGGDEATATHKLEKMAKEYAEEHSVTFAKAYSVVMETPEGSALYEESLA